MCGFTGVISNSILNKDFIFKCNEISQCRGPDSTEYYQSKIGDFHIHQIFNRLSVLDLSKDANQPMVSKEFDNSIMFNGEIYNHAELRKLLIRKNLGFKTNHSDTEVLLNGLSYFGIEFINQLIGQFSIFFNSTKNKKAYLVRDRLGQKPLYYRYSKNNFSFGSNLKTLLKINNNSFSISDSAVSEYLNYGYVSSPNTIFNDYKKIKPGNFLTVDYSGPKIKIFETEYWNVKHLDSENDFNTEEFFDIFDDANNIRQNADVDVANFLSGGLDSSSIVKSTFESNKNINTFSIYVDNKKYDESEYIKTVVNKYNTNHVSVNISSQINTDDILESINSLDEPYSDPSVVPSYILSKEISKHYKVAISGDGGDELLGGYKRTLDSLKNSSNFLSNLFSYIYYAYPPYLGSGNKFLSKSSNLETRYRSYLEDEKLLDLLGLKSQKHHFANDLNNNPKYSYKELIKAEYKLYLPEMMMFKVDRTSMANSLEVRSPFVDHRLVEYILSTSNNQLERLSGKKLLKSYLSNDFNNEFINRKKQGFVFDVESWVFNNIVFINEYLDRGSLVKDMKPNILNLLTRNKTRINGIRIFKLFILENYLQNL